MNAWERQANQSLQSLGDAYQRGHIDRGEYRARRRRLLFGLRERQAQTQPNVLRPAASMPDRRDGGPVASCRKCALVRISCAIIAMGLIAWWLLRRGG